MAPSLLYGIVGKGANGLKTTPNIIKGNTYELW